MKVLRVGARQLPAHASIEQVRKEAKTRLKSLRRQGLAAKLAEVQLTVAREYGFASWRALKSYVDAANDLGERLVQAVRDGDLAEIRVVLDRHPELVNCTTDQHQRVRPSDTLAMRLIHVAVAENQLEVARLLIERGADLDVRNADGRLPLHDCFELGRDGFLETLLAGGAEPDAAAAAAWGMLDRLEWTLRHHPDEANDLTTGTAPLGWSAYGNQPDAARLLFDHGAVIIRQPYAWNAWQSATLVAATPVAEVYLDNGADPNCRNDDGDTPMHAVIRSRIVADPTAFVTLLLDRGADPAIPNHAGLTPLDLALTQADVPAETYYPARPIARKRLGEVLRLLR